MKRVTIYDVAKEANVSLATVSRVVNGADVVKENTRKKVEDAISKLGYKPNAVAQGLALQKTTTIGMVIKDASLLYTGQIINGVLDAAKIKNYNIMIQTISSSIRDINAAIENIIKSRVDGVIIYYEKINAEEIQELKNYNIPIVFIGNKIKEDNIGSVYIDYKKIAYDACTLLLNKGVKDITYLEDRHHNLINSETLEGIKEAFKEKKLKFNGYINIPANLKTSYDTLNEYFKKNTCEAMIVHRDSQAMAAINAAKENNINVPNDMQLLCLLDTKYNLMARPQISSYSVPSYDLGAIAMAIIEKMLNNKIDNSTFDTVKELQSFYIPRKSTL